MANEARMAKALGWFSIGLGAAQVVAPKGFAQTIGLKGDARDRWLTRLVGVRELVAGAGILIRRQPSGWLWSRVAGDAMDLALLGAAFTSRRTDKSRLAAAAAAAAGVMIPDVLAGRQVSRRSGSSRYDPGMDSTPRFAGGAHMDELMATITVNCPPEEAYRFWRDFENLPRFMAHVESVQVLGNGRSHWRAKAPVGGTVEWDAEIADDRPNELIVWRSLPEADVRHAGTVHFTPAPGGRGTEVRVALRYDPPAGPLGAIGARVARLWGASPDQQVREDLRAFKQVLETGEVPQSEATIHGRPHPARPPERVPDEARRRQMAAHSVNTLAGAAA